MDAKTLSDLKATVTEVHVSRSRKASTGDYGSVGAEMGLTLAPAPDANIENLVLAAEAYCDAHLNAWGTATKNGDLAPVATPAAPKSPQGPENGPSGHAGMLEGAPTEEVRIAKYVVTEEPGEKYRLELYPLIKGAPGKYPEIRMVSDKDRMWLALKPVWGDVGKVPSERVVNWIAEWKQGREYEGKDGTKKNYKDLVALRMEGGA